MSLKLFADDLPDYAKDLRLNLSSILNDQLLDQYERKQAQQAKSGICHREPRTGARPFRL